MRADRAKPTVDETAKGTAKSTASAGRSGDQPALPLWDLVQTAHLAGRRFTEVFARAGLTPAQFGVLACLVDGDDLSQADLARVVLVRPQSMGRLISDMVAAGLVRRSGPGGRGRRTGIVITARGRRAHDQARPEAYAINRPGELGLSAVQVQQLIKLLGLVHGSLAGTEGER